MSYQKIHKLSDIDNIPTYRLSITSGVSGAGCVRLVAVGLMAVVDVIVSWYEVHGLEFINVDFTHPWQFNFQITFSICAIVI